MRVPLILSSLLIAAQAALAQPATIVSTASDVRSTNLTVYSVGRGLVSQKREIRLPAGELELRFMDVAAKILPETVAIKALGKPGGLSVLEQNYEYDLLSPEKLLEKYVGKEVDLTFQKIRDQSTVEETKRARLLAVNGGSVWEMDGSIVINPGYSRLGFPTLPPNLIAKPTLVWLLASDAERKETVEASYLTSGIGWRADYVLSLEPGSLLGDLQGWVTVNNQSGAAYENARLQLIAGDVNVEQPQALAKRRMAMEMDSAGAPGFEEKSFFEYHLYTLARPATIRDNQQKQISLLEGSGIKLSREYEVRGEQWYYAQRLAEQKQKVAVILKIGNTKDNRLGIALPKGIVRVYQRDTDGSAQFVGEDSIDHTPRDEELELRLGNAFDIVSERKQTDYSRLANNLHESAFEVVLRNHKDEDVAVKVVEPLGGDWQMIENSHDYEKTSAFQATFRVPVPKNGETKLRYRVRVKY